MRTGGDGPDRARYARSAALTCVLAVAGVLGPAFSIRVAAETHVVTIENMRFNPPALMVHRGDRVIWRNKDLFPHTATAIANRFDSQSIAPDAIWSYDARTPGRYAYRCSLHPAMHGTLVVK